MTDDRNMEARRRWARRMMDRAPGAPAYGSGPWLELAEDDPARVAAVVRAAECWARGADELETNLRAEVEALSAAFKADEDADYVARRDAHRDYWSRQRLPLVDHHEPHRPPADLYDIGAEWRRGRGGAA